MGSTSDESVHGKRRRLTYFQEKACCLEDLKALTSQMVEDSDLTFASSIQKKIPLYDCKALEMLLQESKMELMAEWSYVLRDGPGVLVLQGAFQDHSVLDACSATFSKIVEEEKAKKGAGGDHFAEAGANDRIWNAHEKLCLCDPSVFASYYSNEWIAAASEAWLGPMYQVTAQLNTIRPGGRAQKMHRDYHLGFQSMQTVARFPAHVQVNLSPMLTLQGAVAHVDIPIEAGPTKLLPFSHLYKQGYLAWKRSDFMEFFESNFVQLPLKKGDLLFFNPALFHAGGDNNTSGEGAVMRTVNLLQVSSAFGRSMETLDRLRMCKALYPFLQDLRAASTMTQEMKQREDCAIAACAEGYQFPTNLDLDVPVGSVAPLSQAELMKQSLEAGLAAEVFFEKLDAQAALKRS
eukprot:TRINITY_DN8486_c0_g1_i1.p1 TRINITY_DN8486_c0_g1~~TRINITY_DN8486_c0_g1_i1.p1  ORF type:complete len:406 (+),score=101.66 TRINITY_DN8486_c0_g1_i1:211-1428(+)